MATTRAGLVSSRVSWAVALVTVSILGAWITVGASAATPSAAWVTTVSAATSGRCSEAEARRIVEQLRLGDPYVTDPFGKVLCGPFAGPGSQAMVVMLRGQGNTGFVHWVVFRWAGGAWQFLMKQPAGASITAAGSDIRQTLPIYRPADSRCCPSGGRKTRIWRWNGARFTASPWKRIAPGASTAPTAEASKSGYFKTPSGNIVCYHSPAPRTYRGRSSDVGSRAGSNPRPLAARVRTEATRATACRCSRPAA